MADNEPGRQLVPSNDILQRDVPELFNFYAEQKDMPALIQKKLHAAIESFRYVSRNLAKLTSNIDNRAGFYRQNVNVENLPQVSHYEDSLWKIMDSVSSHPRSRQIKGGLCKVLADTVKQDLCSMRINQESLLLIRQNIARNTGLNIK